MNDAHPAGEPGLLEFHVRHKAYASAAGADLAGLAPEALADPGDLAVTTDFRTVLGEILELRLGNSRVEEVFPGFAKGTPLGICKAG